MGRERELDVILRLLDDPSDGPRAVLLDGPPGIGKTILWHAGLDGARDFSQLVLVCRPTQAEGTLPFCALGDLLEPVLDEALPGVPEPQRRAIEVALQRTAPRADPDDGLALARGVLGILRNLAAERPLTLAIDDVQCLDAPSAQALAFALRRLGEARVRLLLTQRSDTDTSSLELDETLPFQRLTLGPLTVEELGRLIVARTATRLSRRRLNELHRMSGGNPFFALEIVRPLDGDAAVLEWDAPLPVPERVAMRLRRRIGALSAAAVNALVLVAAAPQPTLALLDKLTPSRAGLEEALDAEILEREGERLRFTHPLLASVVFDTVEDDALRDAHARLAAAAADTHERAWHLAQATVEPHAGIATELGEAASLAHRRGAPAVAAELAQHACRLTPADAHEALLTRTAQCAEYHLAAGNTEHGRELLEQVVSARAPGPERAPLLLRLGHVAYLTDDVAGAHRLFAQALAESGDDLRLRAEAEQALAFTAMYGGDIPTALAYARSSLVSAERLDDAGILALALCRVALDDFLVGGGLDRARMEEAVRLETHVRDVPVEWLPSYAYAGIAVYADDLETARALYAPLYASAVERRDERAVPTLLFAMSQLECAAGNWSIAARYADEAVERSRHSGLASLQANALAAQALVSALVGRVDEARAGAAESIRIATGAGALPPLAWSTSVLGFLELSLDDPVAAHGYLGPLAETIVASGLGDPGTVRFMPDEIEALIALGQLEAAEEPLQLLEERGRVLDRVSALAAAGRCRALLEAARGDFDTASANLKEALGQHDRIAQPFERGRTLLAQGSIERRAKHRAAARESLARALEVFDALGAPLWAEKAAAELARIPGRGRSAGELTESERRVAELVAEGLSNKEVAARLFVTVRTVETHLSKVYAKFGVRSRRELPGLLRD